MNLQKFASTADGLTVEAETSDYHRLVDILKDSGWTKFRCLDLGSVGRPGAPIEGWAARWAIWREARKRSSDPPDILVIGRAGIPRWCGSRLARPLLRSPSFCIVLLDGCSASDARTATDLCKQGCALVDLRQAEPALQQLRSVLEARTPGAARAEIAPLASAAAAPAEAPDKRRRWWSPDEIAGSTVGGLLATVIGLLVASSVSWCQPADDPDPPPHSPYRFVSVDPGDYECPNGLTVAVEKFDIGVDEVTLRQFLEHDPDFEAAPTTNEDAALDLPVLGVDLYAARDYCRKAHDARLPTLDEWLYAAQLVESSLPWPSLVAEYAHFDEAEPRPAAEGRFNTSCTRNMLGNAAEWVEARYRSDQDRCMVTDESPTKTHNGFDEVYWVLGGSFANPVATERFGRVDDLCETRYSTERTPTIGFRCARGYSGTPKPPGC